MREEDEQGTSAWESHCQAAHTEHRHRGGTRTGATTFALQAVQLSGELKGQVECASGLAQSQRACVCCQYPVPIVRHCQPQSRTTQACPWIAVCRRARALAQVFHQSHRGRPMAPADAPPAIALALAERHSQAGTSIRGSRTPPHRGCVSLSPLVRPRRRLWLLPQRVLSVVRRRRPSRRWRAAARSRLHRPRRLPLQRIWASHSAATARRFGTTRSPWTAATSRPLPRMRTLPHRRGSSARRRAARASPACPAPRAPQRLVSTPAAPLRVCSMRQPRDNSVSPPWRTWTITFS